MTATFLEQARKLCGHETWHKQAWKRFEAIGLPNKANEVFRYVRLRAFFERPIELEESRIPSVPTGVIAITLSKAWHTYGAFLEKRLAIWLKQEKDPFALLNAALEHEGVFLYVPPNTKIEKPLQINTPRLIVYVARGAELSIVGNIGFCDFAIEENASATIQREITHFQTLRATLKRDATFKSIAFASSAKQPSARLTIARDDYHVQLQGEGSNATLVGLSRLDGKQECHTNVLMEHIAPHTTSSQKFKGVIDDFVRSTFEGKIYVHPQAQKTQAYQMNNYLILSPKAEAKSKPNLEIFADDVKASHGATTGQLDEDALFYLLTRGIPKEEAKQLLIAAFCREVINEAIG